MHHVENVPEGIDISERLTLNERIQHVVMFASFTTLAVTGFMVRLPGGFLRATGLASAGAFEWRGHIHRVSGIVLILVSLYHAAYLLATPRGRWQFRELLPRKRDWDDFRATMRHFRRPETAPSPVYGWFNYKEKAEYWALVWGTFIMALTGWILWLEELSPKVVIDAATVVHRYEAILAVLAVFVWHFYHVHFAPEVFPMSPIWIVGRDPRQDVHPEPEEVPVTMPLIPEDEPISEEAALMLSIILASESVEPPQTESRSQESEARIQKTEDGSRNDNSESSSDS